MNIYNTVSVANCILSEVTSNLMQLEIPSQRQFEFTSDNLGCLLVPVEMVFGRCKKGIKIILREDENSCIISLKQEILGAVQIHITSSYIKIEKEPWTISVSEIPFNDPDEFEVFLCKLTRQVSEKFVLKAEFAKKNNMIFPTRPTMPPMTPSSMMPPMITQPMMDFMTSPYPPTMQTYGSMQNAYNTNPNQMVPTDPPPWKNKM